MKNILIILFLSLFASQIYACDENGNSGFLPENDLQRPVDSKLKNSMTEEKFNSIIDRVDTHYSPIVNSLGGKLAWNRKWNDGTVNASAQRFFKTYKVNMYGGLARHELVTDDAFAMVVCHELGHHLAGAPKVAGTWLMKWASNEGQSDYFASLKCFRRTYESDDNVALMANISVPQTVTDKCSAAYTQDNDRALCMRIAMAGQSLANLLGSLRSTTEISFDTPDSNQVTRINDKHPAAQCRLDTYFQGALCDKRINEDVDNKDPLLGTCNRSQGYTIGTRPLCWYKPAK